MATLKRKDRSPYWHGIYKLANGKLRSRSTKTTKNAKLVELLMNEIRRTKIRNGKSDEARDPRIYGTLCRRSARKGWSAEDAIKAIVKLQEIGSGKN